MATVWRVLGVLINHHGSSASAWCACAISRTTASRGIDSGGRTEVSRAKIKFHEASENHHQRRPGRAVFGAEGFSVSPRGLIRNGAEVPKPRTAECDNPEAERLKTALLVAQGEQDQIRRELSYQPNVISGPNLELKTFKSGHSGLDVGGPPLLETKPMIPARMTEVNLEKKIASLKRALRIACDSPEDAGIQMKLDQAEQELNLLQRQLVLDQAAYYSKPNYAGDAAGKARLDCELEQRQYLQSEIERLKGELAASQANQIAK